VIEDFLGRPVSPQALLDDMARAVVGEGERSPTPSAADRAPRSVRLAADG